MKARDFLLTDPKIEEAVSNGYDIRLSEEEWIAKMELYADTKQKLSITSIVRDLPDYFTFAEWIYKRTWSVTGGSEIGLIWKQYTTGKEVQTDELVSIYEAEGKAELLPVEGLRIGVCVCANNGKTTEVNKINDVYVCCTCNKMLASSAGSL